MRLPKSKAEIAAKKAGWPGFADTAQNHIMKGDNVSDGTGAHSGLHTLRGFPDNHPNGLAIYVDGDLRVQGVKTFKIRTKGDKAFKVSTVFPPTLDWAGIRAIIEEAWLDYAFYKNEAEYISLVKRWSLQWVGRGTIGGMRTWIGCTEGHSSSIKTAFPAVRDRFTRASDDTSAATTELTKGVDWRGAAQDKLK